MSTTTGTYSTYSAGPSGIHAQNYKISFTGNGESDCMAKLKGIKEKDIVSQITDIEITLRKNHARIVLLCVVNANWSKIDKFLRSGANKNITIDRTSDFDYSVITSLTETYNCEFIKRETDVGSSGYLVYRYTFRGVLE